MLLLRYMRNAWCGERSNCFGSGVRRNMKYVCRCTWPCTTASCYVAATLCERAPRSGQSSLEVDRRRHQCLQPWLVRIIYHMVRGTRYLSWRRARLEGLTSRDDESLRLVLEQQKPDERRSRQLLSPLSSTHAKHQQNEQQRQQCIMCG